VCYKFSIVLQVTNFHFVCIFLETLNYPRKKKYTKTRRRIISDKMAEETHFVPLWPCALMPLHPCVPTPLCLSHYVLHPNVVDRIKTTCQYPGSGIILRNTKLELANKLFERNKCFFNFAVYYTAVSLYGWEDYLVDLLICL